MKKSTKVFLGISLLLVCACSEKEEVKKFAYELRMTEDNGTFESSMVFGNDDTKDVFTDDIYFQFGLFWANGEQANKELFDSFQKVDEYWEENGGNDYCDFSLVPTDKFTQSAGSTKSTEDESVFPSKDVADFCNQLRDAEDELINVTPNNQLPQFQHWKQSIHSAIDEFKNDPGLEMYNKVKTHCRTENIKIISYHPILYHKGDDLSYKKTQVRCKGKVEDVFKKYDNIFHIPLATPKK